jgi:hypothetical protein
VGIFFVTQNPSDVPDEVLGQLGNRVQHALRAFTPDDAAALSKAVRTYPKTTNYDLSQALQSLGTGEAIVTVLSDSGAPTPVAWTRLRAPRSLMAQIDPAAQAAAVKASPLDAKYGTAIDRDSAYERLQAKLNPPPAADAPAPTSKPGPESAPHRSSGRGHAAEAAGVGGVIGGILGSSVFKSFARSAGSALGREITRDVLGTRKR